MISLPALNALLNMTAATLLLGRLRRHPAGRTADPPPLDARGVRVLRPLPRELPRAPRAGGIGALRRHRDTARSLLRGLAPPHGAGCGCGAPCDGDPLQGPPRQVRCPQRHGPNHAAGLALRVRSLASSSTGCSISSDLERRRPGGRWPSSLVCGRSAPHGDRLPGGRTPCARARER